MSSYHYENGAVHHDQHREQTININGGVSGDVLMQLAREFLWDDEETPVAEVKEVKQQTAIPDALCTKAALVYWELLEQKGFVDGSHMLLESTSRKQAMYIAESFAEKLRLKSKWKPFQDLWHICNLAQEKWDCQQTGTLPPRYNEIDKIFED